MTDGQLRGMSTLLQCDSGDTTAYVASLNTGHKIGLTAGGGTDGLVFDYGFPLMGILGANTSRFFPLYSLNTLRLEHTLDFLANFTAVNTATSIDSFTITNVEFIGNIITLSDEAQSMVNEQNPGNIYLKSRTFKQSAATIPAQAIGNYQLQVGWRASSLVGILMTCYTPGMSDKKFGSICPNLTQPSHFLINGQSYPQRALNPVDKPAGTFASLQKFWGSLSSTQHCGCISTDSFLRSSAISGNMLASLASFNNQFYLGIDTEVVSKRSDSLLAGIDVNSTPIFFNA
jgi:hypothetical protein